MSFDSGIKNKKDETNLVFKFPNGKFKSVWWMPRLKMAMKDVAWLR